ncbi:MAG: hypothetical protein A3D89_03640 [Planctomycetes bacterium RIFCSPHIGHO2_02_FULL_52_58]|nr:MAG: hypothetical protein A3D89_03640 [Planctomycetes bacterium RIFCSPHIGHO2_02_FULL_52_58]
MRKIISLFQRNYDTDRLVRNEVVPGAEWVIAGEGVATRKFDGTACMVKEGKLYKRYDAKKGKTPPPGFQPCQDPDPVTGHWPGWVKVGWENNDKYYREALTSGDPTNVSLPDGTYELCGPKIQGNHEQFDTHRLIPHGIYTLPACPRDFDGIKEYLKTYPLSTYPRNIEGIVWHHPDGRMVKIKAKDFGIKRQRPSIGSNEIRL